jgi:hypothetical protein
VILFHLVTHSSKIQDYTSTQEVGLEQVSLFIILTSVVTPGLSDIVLHSIRARN